MNISKVMGFKRRKNGSKAKNKKGFVTCKTESFTQT